MNSRPSPVFVIYPDPTPETKYCCPNFHLNLQNNLKIQEPSIIDYLPACSLFLHPKAHSTSYSAHDYTIPIIIGKTCLLQSKIHVGKSPVVIRSPAFASTLHTGLSRPQCLCQSTRQTNSPSLAVAIWCLPSILASHADSTISRRRCRN